MKEPFPLRATAATPAQKVKAVTNSRLTPYPKTSDLKFLSPAEKAELEVVQKIKEEHALVVLVVQRKERDATETTAYLTQTCLIKKEREELESRYA